jgi:regulator of protease activity HflC (stomatin/prohibitin superfamily)
MSQNDDYIDVELTRNDRRRRVGTRVPFGCLTAFLPILGVFLLLFGPIYLWNQCRIDVPSKHMAVLIKKTGKDLPNDVELAPSSEYKGVQAEVLREGRYFRPAVYNPYFYDWVVVPQIEIPEGKLGVRIRLHGDNLGPGELIAFEENQKGIVADVLTPGRYAVNAWLTGTEQRRYDSYAEHIELHEPVTVPAGFMGVVTNLTDPMPDDPNVLLVPEGRRGVQEATLEPGTYYVNPYVTRINLVDCRSQRFNLTEEGDMGFPSKDGFWIRLDGVIEFRIKPEMAAHVYVVYNDASNGETIDEEIVSKIILPNARSFCRLRGSNHSGREFIRGDTRAQFQQDFQEAMAETCDSQGVEVIQALITKIRPPEKIAEPVRASQIAVQMEQQYGREIKQQISEQELAVEQEMVKRKRAVVEAEQAVVKVVTEAKRQQEVAVIEANQRLKVAEFELKAAQDQAAATLALGKATADVIRFDNEAEAAGWRKSVEAFSGEGNEFARWVFLSKIAPAFRSMMVNTADSPLMDMFGSFDESVETSAKKARAGTSANPLPAASSGTAATPD